MTDPQDSAVEVAHTALLPSTTLRAVRALLHASFDDWSDDDWDHTLGGLHVLIRSDSGSPVAHASVVQRTLLVDDAPVRTGYVEAVAVAEQQRRRGLGARIMDRVETIIDDAYPLGALSVSESARAFYETRDWSRWRGPTSVITPRGVVRTPEDDGGIYVRGALPTSVDGPLACTTRRGDPW